MEHKKGRGGTWARGGGQGWLRNPSELRSPVICYLFARLLLFREPCRRPGMGMDRVLFQER